jgi:hypothetical protein
MVKKTKNTKNTIRKNTRKPSRKMNKKTNKKTMRKYGKKGGLLPSLLNRALIINNAAHRAADTPYPYTTGTHSTISTNFHRNPLVTQYGEEEKPSVLHEYTNIDDTPSTGFIYFNEEGNVISPPPPKNPYKGKKYGVDDNNKNNNNPLDHFKKNYNLVDQYNNKREERIENVYANVEKAKEAIKYNPNYKNGIYFGHE